jgi:hypothetical protein
MKTLKFDVFGQNVAIVETESGWQAFYSGPEGKRRPASDIIVPSNIEESELVKYLDDLCHEWASDRNNSVTRVD